MYLAPIAAFTCLLLAFTSQYEDETTSLQSILDFENTTGVAGEPIGWASTDSSLVCRTSRKYSYNGDYCAELISTDGEVSYFERITDAGFIGRELEFSGFVKGSSFEDESFAGAYIILYDDSEEVVDYGYYQFPVFPGVNEWSEFSLVISNSCFAESLDFGMFSGGACTLWVDGLSLELDGDGIAYSETLGPLGLLDDHRYDSGSLVELNSVNRFQLGSLELLGKVWAFLKYHHPDVCMGNVNWDYQLFSVLPAVLEARTECDRETAVLGLLHGLSNVLPNAEVASPSQTAKLHTDLSWVNPEFLGDSLYSELRTIYLGRHQGERYYVRSNPRTRFVENPYMEIDTADPGYRLLALYRFWGMIEYYFPYRYCTNSNWGDQLLLSLPDFLQAQGDLEYQLSVLKLLGTVGDTHVRLVEEPTELEQYLGEFHVPARLRRLDGHWVVDGFNHPDTANHLKVGDVIIACDGMSLDDIELKLLPYGFGSNQPSMYHYMNRNILRGNSIQAELTVERAESVFTIVVARYPLEEIDYNLPYVPSAGEENVTRLNNNIVYAYVSGFDQTDLDMLAEMLVDCSGLILDLRDYPQNFLIYDIASLIVPGNRDFALFTACDPLNPGTFDWDHSVTAGCGGDLLFNEKIAILVNERTVSRGEFFTMAFMQGEHSRVFGTNTAGADGDVSSIVLPGGLQTRISGVGVYLPDSSETQRIGLVPDKMLLPTVESLAMGQDIVLQEAMNWVTN